MSAKLLQRCFSVVVVAGVMALVVVAGAAAAPVKLVVESQFGGDAPIPNKFMVVSQIAFRSTLKAILATVVGVVAILALCPRPSMALMGYGNGTTFGSPGSAPGQFKEPAGIAVNDESGDVYVYDAGNLRVEWFNANGSQFEGQLSSSGQLQRADLCCRVAVRPTHPPC